MSPSASTIVSGGAGFIGSHLVEHLRTLGRRVVIIDDLSTGRLENLSHLLGDGCELVRGRVADVLKQRPSILDGVGEFYHLAAAVGVQLVVDDPAAMIRNNVEQTAVVLESAAASGASVLIASSSEVYGRCLRTPLSEEQELVFGPTSASRWSYGMSKALDEHLALSWHKSGRLGAVIVRLFNTIGPRQIGRYGMVVPRFVQWAIENKPLVVHGSGQQTRSFCDVRDVVRAMPRLLGDRAHHGRAYNLGSDLEVTIDQLADRVIALAGSASAKQHVSYEQAMGEGFEDPQRRRPDLSRIRRAIGFTPMYPLDQTLGELIALARPGNRTIEGQKV